MMIFPFIEELLLIAIYLIVYFYFPLSASIITTSVTIANDVLDHGDYDILDLSYSNLSIIDEFTLRNFSHKKYRTADFSHNPVTKIKNISVDSLYELRISYGDLHKIQREVFKYLPNLRQLLLTNNPHFGHFTGDEHLSLEVLDVSHCGFAEISVRNLPNLVLVNYSSNSINSIKAQTFYDNIQLEIIDLSDNKIVEIEEYAFIKNSKLSDLNLSGNRLLSIEFTIAIKNIKTLNLSKNFITSIDYLMLFRTEFLDVSQNEIKILPEELGRLLPSVKTLNVDSNPIRYISRIKTATLTNLSLRNCKIQYIAENALVEAPQTKTLLLTNNKLKDPKFLFNLPPDLVTSLDENLWSCECNASIVIDLICMPGNVSWQQKCSQLPLGDYSHWLGEVTNMPLIWAPILAGILGFTLSFIAFKCQLQRTRKRTLNRDDSINSVGLFSDAEKRLLSEATTGRTQQNRRSTVHE